MIYSSSNLKLLTARFIVKSAIMLAVIFGQMSGANSQDTSQSIISATPLPHAPVVDENGVDLWTGGVTWSMPSLSIGRLNGGPNLALHNVWGSGGPSHNFLCYAVPWTNPGYGGNASQRTIGLNVVCNNKSTQFIGSGNGGIATGVWTSAQVTGETLTPTNNVTDQGLSSLFYVSLLYTDRDGNQTLLQRCDSSAFGTVAGYASNFCYSNSTSDGGSSFNGVANYSGYGPMYFATSTKSTNGETISYNYNVYHNGWYVNGESNWVKVFILQSVQSSNGFQLQFTYPSTYTRPKNYSGDDPAYWDYTVTAINNSVESCPPLGITCTLKNPWPTLTYYMNQAGGLPSGVIDQYVVLDSMSRQTKYNISFGPYVDNNRPVPPIVLTSILSPGGENNISAAYNWYNSVTSITKSGISTIYNWKNVPNYYITIDGQLNSAGQSSTQQVTVTDANGGSQQFTTTGELPATGVEFEALTSKIDALGRTTSYTPACEGMPALTTYPEGNEVQISVDSRCNVTLLTQIAKPGSGLPNLTSSAGYDTTCSNPVKCNKPNWAIDALGKETDYTYDSTYGVMTSATRPADSNGVRPQKRSSYSALQAYFLNIGGSIVASGSPTVVLSGTSECKTTAGAPISGTTGVGPFSISGAATCVATSDETKSTISYGLQANGTSNNLYPTSTTIGSGTGTPSYTSKFTYDMIGNLISTTDPNGNISYITYDALRRKVFEVAASPGGGNPRLITHHVYDADGHEVRTEIGTGYATDGTDFTLLRHKQMTFDPNTGQLKLVQELVP